jgi:GT2 family glycosyltransferase
MSFEIDKALTRNHQVQLVFDGGTPFFVLPGRRRVQTDKIGKAVWDSLPNPVTGILTQVQDRYVVSEAYLKKFITLLLRAGVLHLTGEKAPLSSAQVSKPAGVQPEGIVSVVVVTYNGSEHLNDCFSSLFNQTYPQLEIIVVDNASSDATVERINRDFPSVKVLALKRNRHYAGGVNQGLQQAQGKYCLVLNQDVELDPDCIHRLVLAMQRETRIGAAVPMMKFFHLRGFINGIGNQVRRKGWGSDNFIGAVEAGQFSTLAEVPSACFGAVMLRRQALLDVGLLDEGYGSFYEDVDWSFRCWYKGWKIVPQVEAVVYHKFGASYPQGRKLRFVLRNRYRLVLKLFRKRPRLSFLKSYLRDDAKNLVSSLKRRELSLVPLLLQAYLSTLFRLPGIYRKGRKVMREKLPHVSEKDILEKNPEWGRCLNEKQEPCLDSEAMLGYYTDAMRYP